MPRTYTFDKGHEMKRRTIDSFRWHEMDCDLRRQVEAWARCEAHMIRTIGKTDREAHWDWKKSAAGYEKLAQAAKASSDAFFRQWNKTLGNLTKATDLGAELKEQSPHFRKPETLLNHAMRVSDRMVRHGPRALRKLETFADHDDWLDDIWPVGQRLIIDHALYALYVAWRPETRILIPDNRIALLRAAAFDESMFRVISPREFEELVAYLYECLGCRVLLTPSARDFGADVLAWHGGPLDSETLIAVQVKRYAKHRKVGLKGLFELHGAVAHYRADTGHLVTTSGFTGPARHFANEQRLHLVDVEKFQEEIRKLF